VSIINPMTGEAIPWEKVYTTEDTIVGFGLEPEQVFCIKGIVNKHALKLCITDFFTDLLAIPYMCAIANPTSMTEEKMGILINFWCEAEDNNLYLVFTRPPAVPVPKKITRRVMVIKDIPANKSIRELKLVQYKKKIVRQRKLDKKYEDKVLRILCTLKKLKAQSYVYSISLAREFNVSIRTVQRDNSSWSGKIIDLAYEKAWLVDNFYPFDLSGPSSYGYIHPMSSRIFYSNNATGVLPTIKAYGRETSWLRLQRPLSNGIDPLVFSISRRIWKNDPAQQIIHPDHKQTIEIFQNLKVPGDYVDLNRPRYEIRVQENLAPGGKYSSIVSFNDLTEIKEIFRKNGWKSIVSGSDTPWDSFDINLETKRLIDELTIPYLLLTDTIVQA